VRGFLEGLRLCLLNPRAHGRCATLDQNRERHPLRVLGFYSASVVRRPAPVLDCSSHSSHETAGNFGWLLAHMTRLVEPRPCDVQRDLTASMSLPAHPNFHRRARRAQQSAMPLDSGDQTRETAEHQPGMVFDDKRDVCDP
ncbi:hypothetical protein TGAM01_v204388, partial [Trichoderma gamsii]